MKSPTHFNSCLIRLTPSDPRSSSKAAINSVISPGSTPRSAIRIGYLHSLIPSYSVTSSITHIWKSRFTGEWDTWTSVPREEKDIWFDAFKDKYKWDKMIDFDVRRLFNIVGSKSFRGYMCRAKKKPYTEKPQFMSVSEWQALRSRWELPEFIEKSDRGKVARQANKRLHVGGSISSVEHKRRLQKELEREPTAVELFVRTHKRKDNTFVDHEAQQTLERYNEKYGTNDSLDAMSGNVSNTYPRWVEHVGLKNGRVYGLGSGDDEYTLHRNNIDEPSIQYSNNQPDHIQKIMERQQEEHELLRAEQQLLRAKQERLSVIQLEQTGKLDRIVKSQTLFEQNIKRAVSQEMEKATQKLLDAIRYQPSTL